MEAEAHARRDPAVLASPAADYAAWETRVLDMSVQLLGGPKVLKSTPTSRSDVHSTILKGVPFRSLMFLISGFTTLGESDMVQVLGVSTRTLRRQKDTPQKAMPADLASKTWLFAETLAKAADVFGSKERAEEWMSKPATGLDHQRPIDLLQTLQGAEVVNDFLTRLEYGVYS